LFYTTIKGDEILTYSISLQRLILSNLVLFVTLVVVAIALGSLTVAAPSPSTGFLLFVVPGV
jgi:hypothetical protein